MEREQKPIGPGGQEGRAKRTRIIGRGGLLNVLAVLLTVPWLSMSIGWRNWPAWLLVVAVFIGIRWLLDQVTDPKEFRVRLTALEEREAVRRFPAREEGEVEEEEAQ